MNDKFRWEIVFNKVSTKLLFIEARDTKKRGGYCLPHLGEHNFAFQAPYYQEVPNDLISAINDTLAILQDRLNKCLETGE